MGVAEVVAIAGTIIAALVVAIGVLWKALKDERAVSASLQAQLNQDHKRDLRRVAGLSTSLDPPALPPPPLLIRDSTPKPPRPGKSPRK